MKDICNCKCCQEWKVIEKNQLQRVSSECDLTKILLKKINQIKNTAEKAVNEYEKKYKD